MKIAILSDIHSNIYALEAVLNDVESHGINDFILLGDYFGYYPWAVKVYEKLKKLNVLCAIRGNHDVLVLNLDDSNNKNLPYWEMAYSNYQDLAKISPNALEWIGQMSNETTYTIDQRTVLCVHGTPSNPLEGRFYPDSDVSELSCHDNVDILFMGHTHYPLCRLYDKKVVLNPGSVGQPRDGSPVPSWAIWDTFDNVFELKRTNYDYHQVISDLICLKWDYRSILALSKNYTGKLKETISVQ
jgi:putative phosphoesterase